MSGYVSGGRAPTGNQMVNSRILQGQEFQEWARRKGLCDVCGRYQTHEIVRRGLFRNFRPMTMMNQKGDFEVYKGLCIQPTCYTLNEAKTILREPVRERKTHRPRRRNNQDQEPHPSVLAAAGTTDDMSNSFSSSDPSLAPTVLSQRGPGGSHSSVSAMHESAREDMSVSSSYTRRTAHSHDSSNGASVSSKSNGIVHGSIHVGENINRDEAAAAAAPSPEDKTIQELQDYAAEGAFTEFMATLATHKKKGEVVHAAFGLLCFYMPQHHLRKPRASLFASDGWVKNLKDAKEEHQANNEIQETFFLIFWVFSAMSTHYMSHIIKNGGVNSILEVMRKNTTPIRTIELCCGALECFAANKSNKGIGLKTELANKIIAVLLTAIDHEIEPNSDDDLKESMIRTRCYAIRALYNLSTQGVVGKSKRPLAQIIRDSLEGRGIDVIVNALNNDPGNNYLIISVTGLFARLSMPGDGAPESGAVILPTDEMISGVVGVMERVEDAPTLVSTHNLISNLAVIAIDFSELWAEQLLDRLCDKIRRYRGRDKALVRMSALRALSSILLRFANNEESVGDVESMAGGVVECMQDSVDNVELQSMACLALAYIGDQSDDSKLVVAQQGGIEAVSIAVLKHLGDSMEDFPPLEETSKAILQLRTNVCFFAATLGTNPQVMRQLNGGNVLQMTTSMLQDTEASGIAQEDKSCISQIMSKSGHNVGGQASVVDALRQARSAVEAIQALSSIFHAAKVKPEVLDQLLASDGVDKIVELMKNYSSSSPVQEHACGILAFIYNKIPFNGRLSQTTQIEVDFREYTVTTHTAKEVEVVRKALASRYADEFVACNSSLALLAMTTGLGGGSRDLEAFRVPPDVMNAFENTSKEIVDAMTVHSARPEIQDNCIRLCRFILFLGDSTELRRWAAMLTEKLVSAMKRYKDHESIPVNACAALLAILDEEPDDSAIQFMGRNDCINTLLTALRTNSEPLVELAAETLALLVKRVFTVVGELVDIPDSIECIVGCFNRFPSSAPVALNCSSILMSMSTMHDSYVRSMIAQLGGVSALLGCMTRHTKNGQVQSYASRALAAMSTGIPVEMITDMRESLGAVTLCTLGENLDNPEVENAVFEIFWFLCAKDDFFKIYFTEGNAIPSIVDAMNRHLYHRSLQHSGCSALWTLSSYGDNKPMIGRNGGLRAIINALLAHADAIQLQKEGLTALKNLATTSENKQAVRRNGGEEAIVISMRVHYDSASVISAAFSALNNIAVDTERRLVGRASPEILDCILKAMTRFPSSESVQKNACFLLKSYTYERANIALMQRDRSEFLGRLAFAATRFPDICRERAHYIMHKL